MCEPADALDILKAIPFKVAALVKIAGEGSYEKALINAVHDSVRQDIRYAVGQIEADRARSQQR